MKIDDIRIHNEHHLPELYINGTNTPPFLLGLSDIPASKTNTLYAQRNIALFGKSAVNLVSIDTAINLCWNKATEPDFIPVREEIAGAIQANPEVGVFIRLHMNPPYWWLRDHPDEQILYRTPEGDVPGIDNGAGWRLIGFDGDRHLRASCASEKWLREAGEILRQLCLALDGTREGDAIAGIQIAYGKNGEWHNFGCDVGKPMEARFRRYLRETYQTEEALQSAYGDSSLTFESVPFLPQDTLPTGSDRLFDKQRDRAAMDSRYVHQLTVVEAVRHFSSIIKLSFSRPVLTGAFYGYTFSSAQTATSGHLLTNELFARRGDASDIDYICGPAPYGANRLPDGATMQRAVLESCRLNGILWLTEMDQRPFGEEYHHGHPASVSDLPEKLRRYFTADTPEELAEELLHASIAQLRRNILQPLLAGQGAWYYDHRMIQLAIENGKERVSFDDFYLKTGWWERAELQREIQKLNVFRLHCFDGGYQPVADVLVVVSNKNAFAVQTPPSYESQLISVLGECGVAYDCLYLEDIEKCDAERYRCVFFANVMCITKRQRALIRSRFGNAVIVHFAENGVCDGERAGADNISRLVGMRLTQQKAPELIRYHKKTIALAPDFADCYAIAAEDGVQPLAVYGNGLTAVGKKGNTVYFSGILLEKELLTMVLKESGAWIYSDDCKSVFAGGRYVAVYFCTGGEHTVRLKCGELRVTVQPYTTLLLHTETGKSVL